MSALISSTSKAATLGHRAVRYYAAAALKPTPESIPASSAHPSPSTEAGPSRRRFPNSPQPPHSRDPAAHQRITVPHTSEVPVLVESSPNPKGSHFGPRTGARQAAVRKAQAFARALQKAKEARDSAPPHREPAVAPSSQPLSQPKPDEPTLEDLLAKRPPQRRFEVTDERYTKKYRKAYDAIDRAFTQSQLVRLVREMGWTARTKQPKTEIVPKLMAHWGWETPLQPQKASSSKRMRTKELDSETADVFLALRDELAGFMKGSTPPRLSIVPPPGPEGSVAFPSRTILSVTGSEAQVEKLAEVLERKRKTVRFVTKNEIGDFHPSATLLSALSALHGCFIEDMNRKSLRLSSSEPRRYQTSVRMLIQAAARLNPVQTNHLTATILPALSPDNVQPVTSPADLTLSPFYPSSKGQYPWEVAVSTEGGSMTRLRRTVIWDAKPSRAGELQREERVENARVWASDEGAPGTLGSLMRKCMETVQKEDAQPSVVITFGHLLRSIQNPLSATLYPGDTAATPQHPNPTPPPTKSLFFVPSATPCMLQYPLATVTKRVRRLRYRCVDAGTEVPANRQAVFTWEYPTELEPGVVEEMDEQRAWVDEHEAMMRKAEADLVAEQGGEAVRNAREDEREDPIEVEDDHSNSRQFTPPPGWIDRHQTTISCEVHTLSTANLRLPDRPIDAHLAARSIQQLPPRQRLWNVREFFQSLEDRELRPGEDNTFLPPPTRIAFDVDGKRNELALIANEDCHITEAERGDGVILRTVKTVEPTVAWSEPITHTELEYRGSTSPANFWRSFAEISREVPPNAGALLREIPSY